MKKLNKKIEHRIFRTYYRAHADIINTNFNLFAYF